MAKIIFTRNSEIKRRPSSSENTAILYTGFIKRDVT